MPPDAAPHRLGRPRDPTVDDRVLAAATDLLAERHLGDVTLDLVAERCGIPKSTIYRRWRSKDELLAAALARYVRRSYEVPDTGSVRDDLIALVDQQFAAYTTRQGLAVARYAVEWLAGRDGALNEALHEVASRRRADYLEVIARGQARGEVRSDIDPQVAIDLVFGALWGRMFGAQPVDDKLSETVVDLVLSGIGAGPGRPGGRSPRQARSR